MAAEMLGYLQIMPQCFNRGVCVCVCVWHVCVWHVCGVYLRVDMPL